MDTATIRAKLRSLTFKNADQLARKLNGGKPVGFNPFQRFAKKPDGTGMVAQYADYILATFPHAAIAANLPEFEGRSRAARQFVAARRGIPLPPEETTEETETATAEPDAEGDETETPDDAEPVAYPPGSMEAIVQALVRAELAKHKPNATVSPAAIIDAVKPIIDAAIERAKLPRVTHIHVTRQDATTVDVGIQHKSFADLLNLCSLRDHNGYVFPVFLPGPAGSGKTTAAMKVAEALAVPFHHTGAVDTEYKLMGFIDAQGRIISPAFRKAYETGGVFLFDEIDASHPQALVAMNAALENGHCAFPDGNVERHKDCIVIAAANTFGMGATHEYVGRNKLDAATVDRFIMLEWGYDTALEKALAANDAWTDKVIRIREAVAGLGIKHVVSPRASIRGARMLAQGWTETRVMDMVIRKGLTADQWSSVRSRAGV